MSKFADVLCDFSQDESSSKGSYLHDPWLLQNREMTGIDDGIGTAQVELAENNSDHSSNDVSFFNCS